MGFVNLSHGISEAKLKLEILKLINDKGSDFIIQLKKNNINNVNSAKNLSDFVQTLAAKENLSCPICNSSDVLADKVICRDKIKTIRKCKKCNLDYISFENTEKTEYNSDYFGIEYKNQYGKTYLEDFNSIKKSCLRRHEIVNSIFRKKIFKENKR